MQGGGNGGMTIAIAYESDDPSGRGLGASGDWLNGKKEVGEQGWHLLLLRTDSQA